MPQSFRRPNGFQIVSAGRDAAPAPAPGVADALLARGLSPAGVREVLAAHPVSSLADRRALVGIVAGALDLIGGQGTTAALLVPAIQAAREAARRTSPAAHGALTPSHLARLSAMGMSPRAIHELATGMPVSDADGRYLLTRVAHAARK